MMAMRSPSLMRLGEVVGDEHDGAGHGPLEAEQLVLHVPSDQGIEGRERLVEEQHLGVDGQGPGQADPLLHAARQLLGVVVGPTAEAHHLDHLGRPGQAVGRAIPCTSSP